MARFAHFDRTNLEKVRSFARILGIKDTHKKTLAQLLAAIDALQIY